MSELKNIIMRRDGLSEEEADKGIKAAKKRVLAGEDPEELLYEEFGLEPDYVFDLL